MRRVARRVGPGLLAALPQRRWQIDETFTPRHIVRVPDPSLTKFEGETRREWCDEPSLDDIDRSVPQVDCPFVAELVARRLKVRDGLIDSANEKRRAKEEERITRQAGDDAGASTTAVALDKQADAAEGIFPWRDEYDDGFLLIDCRTVSECTSWGMIEGAKVIPAHELWEALQLQPDAFEEFYGFEKPGKDNVTLLFYCQYGPRSLMAAQIASYLGFQQIVHLRDGYYEWAKQFNKLCRRFQLHDLESGNEHRRATEMHVARGLAREIAPEFNDAVDAEADELLVDATTSEGRAQLGLPANVQELQAELAKDYADNNDERVRKWIGAGARLEQEAAQLETPEIAHGIPRSMRTAADVAEMEADAKAKPQLSSVAKMLFKGTSLDPTRGRDADAETVRAKKRVDLVEERMRNKVPFKRTTTSGTY